MVMLQQRVHGTTPPPTWGHGKLHQVLRVRKNFKNIGMKESNLLSLSYGRIVRKDIDTAEGLLPESFETYQIVEPGNIVMRLTDLQNDKRSLRQGLVHERGIITSAYDALEVGTEHDPRFWAYVLLALDLAKYYYSLGGGVRQSINFADFPNDWISVPDAATQRATADFLDRETARIDQLIEKKECFMRTLAEQRAIVGESIVCGGYEPSATSVSLTDIEKHFASLGWKWIPVKRVASMQGGYAFESLDFGPDGIQLIRIGNLYENELRLDRQPVFLPQTYALSSKPFLIKRGDILMSLTGTLGKRDYGYSIIVDIDTPLLLNQRVGRLRVRSNDIVPEYFLLSLRTKVYLDQLYSRPAGTKQANLSNEDVLGSKIPLPPIEEQRRIIDNYRRRTGPGLLMSQKTAQSIDLLRGLRVSLITEAVTGSLDIASWTKRSASKRRLDAIEAETLA